MTTTLTGAYAWHSLTAHVADVNTGRAAYLVWQDKLTILEHFNGGTYHTMPVIVTGMAANDTSYLKRNWA